MSLCSFCLHTLSPVEIPQQFVESLPLPWAAAGLGPCWTNLLHRCSPPTCTCPPIAVSSDLITAIVWFSLLHPNICWAVLAQHGRALSCFTAYLVLTASEIPAINMLPLESKPVAGVSAGYSYLHRLVLLLCQLIITANLCSFNLIYCHTHEPDDLINLGFMIHMKNSNRC